MRQKFANRIRAAAWCLLFAPILLVLVTVQLAAATDQDGDGLDDAVEVDGCKANQNQPVPIFPVPVGAEAQKFFRNCPGYDSSNAVDGNVRDVFVIFIDKPDPMGPALGDVWLDFIANTTPAPMRVHRVARDPGNYCKCVLAPPGQTSCSDVNCLQKAIMVLEDNTSTLSDTSNVLGITPWQGNPNTAGDITIYTGCIAEDIQKTCSGKTCEFKNETGATQQATSTAQLANLYRVMKKSVIGHESGHTMMLRKDCSPDLGCHYPVKTGLLMDASVFRKTSGKLVTWHIPIHHGDADVPQLTQ